MSVSMKIINPRVHGVLDYVTVIALLAGPALLGLSQPAAITAYALAAVQFVLSLLTAYPLGALKVIPFTVHGALELAIGAALIVLPWLLATEPVTRTFYVAAGAIYVIIPSLTNYAAAARA